MEVQLDLVDEHDAAAEQRVVGEGVRRGEAARDVAGHGEEALFAVGELVDVECRFALVHQHAQLGAQRAEVFETQG